MKEKYNISILFIILPYSFIIYFLSEKKNNYYNSYTNKSLRSSHKKQSSANKIWLTFFNTPKSIYINEK